MAPPLFADLGKATRDVFDKGYVLDNLKVQAKTAGCGALKLKTTVAHKFEDGTFKGDVEGTYPYPRLGLTLTKSWNTENVIGLAAELVDKVYPGVSIKKQGTFAPDTGIKTANISAQYKHENARLHAAVALSDEANTVIDTSSVVGYEGWLAGARLEYDTTEGAVKNHYYALGHSYGAFQAFLLCKNVQLYTFNIYQRVNNRLEMGMSFGADYGEEQKKFYNLGARYLLDEDNSVRAKVDNDSMVGLALESTLGGCVKLTFSTLLDGKKLKEGGHRFGIGVDIGA